MQGLLDFLNHFYNYVFAVIGIDFSSYTGVLPTEFITMYGYVLEFFKYFSIFALVYFMYKVLITLISLGGVR